MTVPRAGMLATVRNRHGVVAAVEPFDGETGRLHLVHLEYKDDHTPSEERILWEIEPSRHLLEPNALPAPAHAGGAAPAVAGRAVGEVLAALRGGGPPGNRASAPPALGTERGLILCMGEDFDAPLEEFEDSV